ncbi:MAG: hypothetical protein AAF533_00850 [Acidobacteriota bacterium]
MRSALEHRRHRWLILAGGVLLLAPLTLAEPEPHWIDAGLPPAGFDGRYIDLCSFGGRCEASTPVHRADDELWMHDSCTRILVSEDAGRSWTTRNVPQLLRPREIRWPTPHFGLIVDDLQGVLVTRDGGASWHVAPGIRPGGDAESRYFVLALGGSRVFLLGHFGLWRSSDQGRSWEHFPRPGPRPFETCRSLHFIDEDDGWCLTSNEAWATRDGGASWCLLPLPLDDDSHPHLIRLDAHRTWKVPARRGAWHGRPRGWESFDDGRTWQPFDLVVEPGIQFPHRLSFPTDRGQHELDLHFLQRDDGRSPVATAWPLELPLVHRGGQRYTAMQDRELRLYEDGELIFVGPPRGLFDHERSDVTDVVEDDLGRTWGLAGTALLRLDEGRDDGEWVAEMPSRFFDRPRIVALAFVDEDLAYGRGDDGEILVGTHQGQSWRRSDQPVLHGRELARRLHRQGRSAEEPSHPLDDLADQAEGALTIVLHEPTACHERPTTLRLTWGRLGGNVHWKRPSAPRLPKRLLSIERHDPAGCDERPARIYLSSDPRGRRAFSKRPRSPRRLTTVPLPSKAVQGWVRRLADAVESHVPDPRATDVVIELSWRVANERAHLRLSCNPDQGSSNDVAHALAEEVVCRLGQAHLDWSFR